MPPSTSRAAPRRHRIREPAGSLARFADARAVVIDDNDANVLLLKNLLLRHGLRSIDTFTDPVQALAHLAHIDPDLLLC